MVFSEKWLKNHPKFLLHFLIHIDVLMLCRKFELIPTNIFRVISPSFKKILQSITPFQNNYTMYLFPLISLSDFEAVSDDDLLTNDLFPISEDDERPPKMKDGSNKSATETRLNPDDIVTLQGKDYYYYRIPHKVSYNAVSKLEISYLNIFPDSCIQVYK